MSKNKQGKPAATQGKQPHPGQTQDFPYIDHQRGKPFDEDIKKQVISWVTANGMKYIHIGLDGKGERFDFNSTKPTREKLILAELGGGVGAIKSLRDLENRSIQIEELKAKAREIIKAEEHEKEQIQREIDLLNDQLALSEGKSPAAKSKSSLIDEQIRYSEES
jgi:hypothetical protein